MHPSCTGLGRRRFSIPDRFGHLLHLIAVRTDPSTLPTLALDTWLGRRSTGPSLPSTRGGGVRGPSRSRSLCVSTCGRVNPRYFTVETGGNAGCAVYLAGFTHLEQPARRHVSRVSARTRRNRWPSTSTWTSWRRGHTWPSFHHFRWCTRVAARRSWSSVTVMPSISTSRRPVAGRRIDERHPELDGGDGPRRRRRAVRPRTWQARRPGTSVPILGDLATRERSRVLPDVSPDVGSNASSPPGSTPETLPRTDGDRTIHAEHGGDRNPRRCPRDGDVAGDGMARRSGFLLFPLFWIALFVGAWFLFGRRDDRGRKHPAEEILSER
jgi:hypothetical protein